MIRVLFVCTGNTCRSPLAEAILKNKNIPHLEVKSAGVWAANGMTASVHAEQVLKENNIDHPHQSSMISEKVINWATHILAMTASHKAAIVSSYPNASEKVFTLTEFVRGEPSHDITDPFGGTLQEYRRTYKELYDNIELLIERLHDEGELGGGGREWKKETDSNLD